MVIITDSINAYSYFSESQWLDAEGCEFCPNAWGFRVPNTTPCGPILGQPASYDPETGTMQPGTPPMTQAAVEAIATEVIFQPEAPKE